MKIEEGKCYIRIDGLITGPLVKYDRDELINIYPYHDPKHDCTYDQDGLVFSDNNLANLIEEVSSNPQKEEDLSSKPIPLGQPGCKLDIGKVKMELLFTGCPRALFKVAEVMTYGCDIKGYGAQNWQKVPDGENRYLSALGRHLIRHSIKKDSLDSESHLLHLSHIACNALFILELALQRMGYDPN
jgi:hypothetical protein